MFATPSVPESVAILTVQADGELSLVVLSTRPETLPGVVAGLNSAEQALFGEFNDVPVEYVEGAPDDADRAEGYRFRDEWLFTPRPRQTVEVVEAHDGEVWAIAPEAMTEEEVRDSSPELGHVDLLQVIDMREDGLVGWAFRRAQYNRAA